MIRHRTEIRRVRPSRALPVRYDYAVVCSCGYVSRWLETHRAALEDEAEHVRLTAEASP